MIVILSWESDGSGKPEIRFFPKGDSQALNIALYLKDEQVRYKSIEIYSIDDIEKHPQDNGGSEYFF